MRLPDGGYQNDAEVIEELLEAIRKTQEYIQLPALEGWTWYNAYRKYRPKDAERLRVEWERHKATRERKPVI